MDFTKEQIEKAKNCQTLEEFKELAKKEGVELSEEEATKYFSATRTGELSDDEISIVSGGGKNDPKSKFRVGDKVKIRSSLPISPLRGKIKNKSYENKEWWYKVKVDDRIMTLIEYQLELDKD